jgi:PAS domain S-box-containing protein
VDPDRSQVLELEYYHKDGSIRDLVTYIRGIRDNEGNLTGIYGSHHDITDRKRAEEALHQRESYLSAIIENQPGLIWLKDTESRFLAVNQAFAISCGKQKGEELRGKTDLDIWPTELAKKYCRDDFMIIKTGKPAIVEEPIVDRGETRWFETFKTPVLDGQGTIIGTTGYAHDITTRKLEEVARRRDRDIIERLAEEMAVVAEIGRVIGSTLDIDEVYERFATEARKLIPFDRLTINLNNHEQNTVTVVYVFGSNILGRNPGDSFPLQGSVNETLERTRRGMLLHLTNIDEFKGQYIHLMSTFQAGIRSFMGVPLISRDKVIGVLHFRSKEPNIYKEQDLHLAERIGAQIAGAIANAKLYKELKATEKSLRESGQRYRLLVENANEAILVIQDGVIKFVNSQTVASFGYSVEELLSVPIFELIHPEDRDMVKERYRQKINGDMIPTRHTCRTMHKSGQIQWVEISSVLIEWEGRPATLNLITNITERKKIEEALQKSEERYRLITENMSDMVRVTDLQGISLYVSPSHLKGLGYKQEEREGKSGFDIVHPEDAEKILNTFSQGLAGNQPMKVEYRVKHANGHYIWLETIGDFLRDAQGKVTAVVMSSRDISDRKQAEIALRESESSQRSIFLAAPIGIGVVSNRIIKRVNDRLCEMLGYSREELIDKSARIFYLTDEEYDFVGKEKYNQIVEYGAGTVETRWIRKDGTSIEILLSSAPLDPSNFETGVTFTALDITERKHAESSLRESELFLRESHRIARLGGWKANPHTDYLEWTEGVYNIIEENFGYKPGLSEGLKFFLPEYIPAIKERVADCLITGEPFTMECEGITATDKQLWTELRAIAPIIAGERSYVIGTFQDITDRKQVEKELFESVEKYRLLADNSSDVIWTMNLNGRLTYISPSVKDMAGYTPEEAMAIPIEKYIFKEDVSWVMDEFYKELQKPREERSTRRIIETRQYKKDGSVLDLEVSTGWLYNKQGELIGIQGTARDISSRKKMEDERSRLERQLRQSQKMEALGQLAGGVAHDLNNVLGILSGYSELLLLEIPEGNRARIHAEKILQSTVKGAAIIQDLLTLARRGVTVSDVINLNGVVSGFLKTPVFERMKDYNHQVTFRTECDMSLLNIKGSPVHLEKTLMNLVANAAESISGKGEVTIRTDNRYLDKPVGVYDEINAGDYAVLTVSDTGMGIPAENREKIFEPFYTKKTMGRSGTGLGLAIVWGTIKDHNGYIDLQTEIGKGTTFTLYFPVTREDMVAQEQKVPIEQYMGKGESILVVDDIAEQRDVASRMLTRLGYKVHAVSSGEDAVEYLGGNRADILVLDMIMAPGIDGLETYRRILEINPQQKAILVSGFSQTERVMEAQKLGAGTYVKKPYAMEKIGMAVWDELNKI